MGRLRRDHTKQGNTTPGLVPFHRGGFLVGLHRIDYVTGQVELGSLL
jgi:hypothetical protein